MNSYVVTVSASQSKSSLQTSKKPFGGVFQPPFPLGAQEMFLFSFTLFFSFGFSGLDHA